MLGVSSSVPANSNMNLHDRSFVVIIRGNERAGPSLLFQRPQNALIFLEVEVVAESCRRHKDWRQVLQWLCTALASSPRPTGNQIRCHSCNKSCSRSVCSLPGSRATHRLLLRTYTQRAVVIVICTFSTAGSSGAGNHLCCQIFHSHTRSRDGCVCITGECTCLVS